MGRRKQPMTFDTAQSLKFLKARAERYDAKAQLKHMSPDEFLSKTPSTLTTSAPASFMREEHFSKSSLEWITAKAKRGEKFETPYLDYTDLWYGWAGHEGRHRAFVAKKLGMPKIPVIVLTPLLRKRKPKHYR